MTLNRLVAAITAAGGPLQYRRSTRSTTRTVARRAGTSASASSTEPTAASLRRRHEGRLDDARRGRRRPDRPRAEVNPGRVAPTNSAWNASRKPLAAEFSYHGHKLFVIVNHFNSKGGDQGLFGPSQPPVLSSEVQRNQQATLLAGFVGDIFALDPTANVAVIGDLNDFQFSPPVQKLKDAGLTPLIETLPQTSATATSSTATARR